MVRQLLTRSRCNAVSSVSDIVEVLVLHRPVCLIKLPVQRAAYPIIGSPARLWLLYHVAYGGCMSYGW